MVRISEIAKSTFGPAYRKARRRLKKGKFGDAPVDYVEWLKTNGKFCFIHIDKCGGSSVERTLGLPDKMHDTAMERRDKIGEARWEQLFTFSVVRDPYARVCSQYRYRVKKNHFGMGDGHIDLNQWVKKVYEDRDAFYRDREKFYCPCLSWITDKDDKIIVKFVAKLENISEDWVEIKKQAGIKKDIRLENTTDKANNSVQDLNEASIRVINREFRADFEVFGYHQFKL